MSLTNFTAEDLGRIESAVVRAVRSGNHDELNVIGYGEISVALGYPTDEPTVVCKRMAITSVAEAEHHAGLIARYLTGLSELGIASAPTACLTTPSGTGVAVYVVQDLLDRETIGHRVLQATEPDAEHPMLVAISNAIARVNDRVSIDAQVTNWSWDGTTATLIDVGTPFLWTVDGDLEMHIAPMTTLFPAVLRSYIVKDLTKLLARWKQPSAVAADLVANLYREGLDEWAAPSLVALNRALDTSTPVTEADARAIYEDDRKSFPLLKKMQAVERAWQTKVRRRPYDYLIAETTFRSA